MHVKNIRMKVGIIMEVISVEEPIVAVRVSQYPEDKKVTEFFLFND